ncbi:DegT/DnrJ/EryC1/StrS family aminotransferase [Geomonas subterranea]|uniref:DegT/DnrJ/EryC1/StrS family aminotransferase n=1 Tax=Geomonas subterranea TaxID=2847989 RepID=UPI001CD59FF3|nr:DegT/DnrJ/EryC1/StrS family aminotransferase [Geomonas fuzhouensis]
MELFSTAAHVEVLGDKNASFAGYGRFALKNLFQLLGFGVGDRILLPAYICDVVLLPFEELGIEPVYYGVTRDFQIDWDSVRLLPRTKALLTVNYFGISIDYAAIEAYTARHGLTWISDNAHGFASMASGKLLEEYGDISLTCFRKVLPSLNGACVLFNSPRYLPLKTELDRLNDKGAREPRLRFLCKSLLASFGIDPWPIPDYADAAAFRDRERGCFRVDPLALKLYALADRTRVRERRRSLYQSVAAAVVDRGMEISEIPGLLREGNSPLVLPVEVSQPGLWRRILNSSRKLGLDLHTWPSLPVQVADADLLGSTTRWRRTLYFPLHQGLDEANYLRVLKKVFHED